MNSFVTVADPARGARGPVTKALWVRPTISPVDQATETETPDHGRLIPKLWNKTVSQNTEELHGLKAFMDNRDSAITLPLPYISPLFACYCFQEGFHNGPS